MVKTRFQIIADPSVGQKVFKNYGEVARAIWREEGPTGFFKGITASYVGCFEGAIQWIVYERLKTLLAATPAPAWPSAMSRNSDVSKVSRAKLSPPDPSTAFARGSLPSLAPVLPQRSLTSTELFLAAAASKCAAVLATYPHEVVRTRLREQATSGVFKYRGFIGTLGTIAKEEGAR
jgi:solute carrier family 25 protein 33/36